jgi:hypothetical protein
MLRSLEYLRRLTADTAGLEWRGFTRVDAQLWEQRLAAQAEHGRDEFRTDTYVVLQVR